MLLRSVVGNRNPDFQGHIISQTSNGRAKKCRCSVTSGCSCGEMKGPGESRSLLKRQGIRRGKRWKKKRRGALATGGVI